jgi:predicted RNase H-like HicB family nuclease
MKENEELKSGSSATRRKTTLTTKSSLAEKKRKIPSGIYLELQEEGGFVAFSKKYPGAVGQGETEEEAIKDLMDAIQLLKEVIEEDRIKGSQR